MTELERSLLAALKKQDDALKALQQKQESQQQQIHSLAESTERLEGSVTNALASISKLASSLKTLAKN